MNDIKNIVKGLLYKKCIYKVLEQFTNLYTIKNEYKCQNCIIFHRVISNSYYRYGKMTMICMCCKCKYRWMV